MTQHTTKSDQLLALVPWINTCSSSRLIQKCSLPLTSLIFGNFDAKKFIFILKIKDVINSWCMEVLNSLKIGSKH